MTEEKAKPIDVPLALRNILMFLQQNPKTYKKFGIYWWAVKDALKEAGYTEKDLYLLKNYRDEEQANSIPETYIPGKLQRAIEEWRFNSGFGRTDDAVEDDDGEVITVWDDDAGF